MDMEVYAIQVVPIVIITYGVFVLFMHPPLRVVGATLAGGLVMALMNLFGDLIAIHASLWYYKASGLIDQLPLPLYTTSIFILGGLAYLLIWRFRQSSHAWLALVLLVVVPLLGFLRDLWQVDFLESTSFLHWQSSLAWTADLVLWIIMFFAGYAVFQLIVPARATVSALNEG